MSWTLINVKNLNYQKWKEKTDDWKLSDTFTLSYKGKISQNKIFNEEITK